MHSPQIPPGVTTLSEDRAIIEYHFDRRPLIDEIASLYEAAPLIRPLFDKTRIARMFQGANLVLTAWDGPLLAGLLRGWTDGAYDGYICDLAIRDTHQQHGIGKQLLAMVREKYPDVQFILRASKIARDYYQHVGWQKIENGWFWPRPDWTQP